MTASVMHMFGVVEASEDPLTIPPRPTPATVINYEQLPNRAWTWRVLVGAPTAPAHVGYVRWDDLTADWIARTRGSAFQAATIRKFRDRHGAGLWLADKYVGAGRDRQRRRAKRGGGA